jgi:hypothetical protein
VRLLVLFGPPPTRPKFEQAAFLVSFRIEVKKSVLQALPRDFDDPCNEVRAPAGLGIFGAGTGVLVCKKATKKSRRSAKDTGSHKLFKASGETELQASTREEFAVDFCPTYLPLFSRTPATISICIHRPPLSLSTTQSEASQPN